MIYEFWCKFSAAFHKNFKRTDFLEFKNKDMITQWVSNNALELYAQQDVNCACAYTKSEEFNRAIRNGQSLTADYKDLKENLERILYNYKTPDAIVVYRGINKDALKAMKKAAYKYNDRILFSKFILETSFLSTSLCKNGIINSDIILKIFVPQGIPMIYIGDCSVSPEQEEVLFGENMLMKIIKKQGTVIEVFAVSVDGVKFKLNEFNSLDD